MTSSMIKSVAEAAHATTMRIAALHDTYFSAKDPILTLKVSCLVSLCTAHQTNILRVAGWFVQLLVLHHLADAGCRCSVGTYLPRLCPEVNNDLYARARCKSLLGSQ